MTPSKSVQLAEVDIEGLENKKSAGVQNILRDSSTTERRTRTFDCLNSAQTESALSVWEMPYVNTTFEFVTFHRCSRVRRWKTEKKKHARLQFRGPLSDENTSSVTRRDILKLSSHTLITNSQIPIETNTRKSAYSIDKVEIFSLRPLNSLCQQNETLFLLVCARASQNDENVYLKYLNQVAQVEFSGRWSGFNRQVESTSRGSFQELH